MFNVNTLECMFTSSGVTWKIPLQLETNSVGTVIVKSKKFNFRPLLHHAESNEHTHSHWKNLKSENETLEGTAEAAPDAPIELIKMPEKFETPLEKEQYEHFLVQRDEVLTIMASDEKAGLSKTDSAVIYQTLVEYSACGLSYEFYNGSGKYIRVS